MIPYLFLAPMAGYTTSSVRLFFRLHGADMVFSEMVSAKAIVMGSKKTFELARFAGGERPIGIQIFGGDPETMSEAARIIEEQFSPDVIDINMGCPVRKVIRQGYGSFLLTKPALALKIAEDVSRAVDIPVSIKTRLGFDRPLSRSFFVELASTGVSFITIHGRTARNMFSGPVDWDFIYSVSMESPVPVIGNGGLLTPEDVRDKFKMGFTGIMVGMGALRDPFIFMKVREKEIPKNPEIYFLQFLAEREECVNVIKRFALHMLRSKPGVRKIKGIVARSRDREEILTTIKEFTLAGT